jgi:hypothetical protein
MASMFGIQPLDWYVTGGLRLLGYADATIAGGATGKPASPATGNIKAILVQIERTGGSEPTYVRWHPGGTAGQGIKVYPLNGGLGGDYAVFWLPISREEYENNFAVEMGSGLNSATVRVYFYGV